MNINNKVFFKDLGLTDYKEAWRFQENLFNSTVKKKLEIRNAEDKSSLQTPNYLLFCEHPHVFTLGKNGSANNLLINEASLKLKNASFVKIDRGGDITYHGPGQIVGYPVLDLENFTPSIRQYVYNLEEAVIRTIEKYDIKGERLEGASGVWLDKGMPGKTRKICAIGIRTSRWVTMHGFAFNVNTDLTYYDLINPCGFTDKKATSLKAELGKELDIDAVKSELRNQLNEVFNMEIIDHFPQQQE